MSICFAPTSAHDNLHIAEWFLYGPAGILDRHAWLCRGCVERLREMGMDWSEDRRAYERREFGKPGRRAA